jgi:hypothetical protein
MTRTLNTRRRAFCALRQAGIDPVHCLKLAGVPERKFEDALRFADSVELRGDNPDYERLILDLLLGPRYALARRPLGAPKAEG